MSVLRPVLGTAWHGARLALWLDTQETLTTDLPHLTRRYVTTAADEAVTGDQIRLARQVAGWPVECCRPGWLPPARGGHSPDLGASWAA